MRSQITQITTSPFTTSDEAGEKLGKLLGYYSERNDTVILSVSPAAANISTVLANTLRLPSSSFIIRQVMSPLVPGLSLGSVGATGGQWWNGEYGIGIVKNEEIIRSAKISQADLDDLIKKQVSIMTFYPVQFYCRSLLRPSLILSPPYFPPLTKKVDEVRSTLPSLADTPQLATLPATILLVDTGVNSTTTIRSAVKLLRHFGYHGRVVLACAVIGADAKVGLSTHLKPSGDVVLGSNALPRGERGGRSRIAQGHWVAWYVCCRSEPTKTTPCFMFHQLITYPYLYASPSIRYVARVPPPIANLFDQRQHQHQHQHQRRPLVIEQYHPGVKWPAYVVHEFAGQGSYVISISASHILIELFSFIIFHEVQYLWLYYSYICKYQLAIQAVRGHPCSEHREEYERFWL
ncbi:hypothetical protein BC936DRAFT_145837 [Jimgerdemannia flammicorona]|uniref:Phosphoribosyltransferase-like protein n=1 Tax=Jimgerdemannia flammicorona TaxID=994334 RepID=A0A433D8Z6_9FUNG|nr:hypothetical protein BC936DRAFT_145837 [Jimgerdemannia flammicorona]